MKILKKALCFLSIIVLLSIFSVIGVSAADYSEGYYTYSVSNGEATITDVDETISGDVTIPASLGGYPVTTIGKSAFEACTEITSISIPNGVTSVGERSFFNCSQLSSVSIPPTLQSYGLYAFYGCWELKAVNISDLRAWIESSFEALDNNVSSNPLRYYADSLYLNGVLVSGDLVIPDGTTEIGNDVFAYYDKFTTITIPSSVETIGENAFQKCSSIQSVYISDLKKWCEYNFVSLYENPLYNGADLYLNDALVAGELVIPEGTETIGTGAFYYNKNITSVVIPDGVKFIGESAFEGCTSIKKIDIGAGVQSIGVSAFRTYSTLEEFNIRCDLTWWCENGFSVTKGALLLNGESVSGRLEIPNGTLKIQSGAFQYCEIDEVIIPASVSYIGSFSFAACFQLSNIEIYGSPNIDASAFGWITSNNAKISFYDEPKSIYDDSYTISSSIDIWCYADNSPVRNYANKYGRDIHFFPCEGSCSYSEIVDTAYLKSEGNCTTQSVYFQSCVVCLNASDTLTFEGDVVHNFAERVVDAALLNAATCTLAAEYHLSCDCGTTHPTQTFTSGEPLGHSYDDTCDEICNRCSFVREAPHNISTIYDYNYDYHWYTCTKCNEKFSYELHSYDDNSDAFCNACDYERTIFVVSYDANGGENAPSVYYVPLGSEATVSSNVPTRENYVFIGWATAANGMVEYKAEDSLNLTESITLYAVWKAECKECDATGETYTTRTCTSCTSGYVYSSSCYYCYGRGKYSTGDMSCGNCYGSGQVKDPYGSGKYVNCLMCGGDGLVPDYQTCYHCRSKCTICNGSTKITDYFDCENCDANGYFDSFEVHYDANGGSGAPSSQTMGGKLDTLSETIPSREGSVFVGWNTLTDNDAVYQPGDAYCNGEVTFYAMWAPVCHSCAGEGHFTEGNTCGACNGNGTYSVTVKTCNSCGGNHIVTHVTGYGTLSYCSNCGSTSIKTSTQTKTCSNCTNGIVGSTYECEDCEGNGYLQTYPKALSFTDTKVVLLKIDGMEYSIDGINWQDSNVFTELLPATEYSFYQRMKATENAPFGVISAPLLLRTDKADNEDVPQTPLAVEITAESIRIDLINGCEYSIDGVNWQSEPLFTNLDCATNYTVYARFAETDTHYASEAISYTIVRTEKGTVSAPSAPTLVAVGRDRVILQKVEGYEYSIDGIHWQSSNAFLALESKTNYFVYCRFAETDQYYASSASDALIVKTLAESEIGQTYQITFQDEYGNILSQASYELYDEIVIPSTLKESDLTYTYTFLQWDKTISELCMGEAVYIATYEKKYIDYEVVFKNYDGIVISSNVYHYGDFVVIPTSPTKESDLTYTYTFAGWDASVASTCGGSATYTATYTPTYIDYTLIFKNEDGTVLSTNTYHYGDEVTAPTAPTKEADNTYTYTFAGWDKEVVDCVADATYIATYNATYIDYTVTFKNEDGSVISTETYYYGDTVKVPEPPTKAADNTYTYTFAGWDSTVVDCNGDKTYTATYTTVYIEYTVVFKDYDGGIISSAEYHYGQTVTKPGDPTRVADNIYTYVFAGWDKTLTSCTESTVYTATYSSTYIEYEIVFKNYDGTILSTNKYHYGDTVAVPEAPTKPADESYTYGFAGWDNEVTACLGDKTYTATFNPTNVEYTVVFKDYNGNVISSETYHFGDEVVVPEAPSRNADNTYTYTFKDWGKTVAQTCVGDAEYMANYEATYIEYSIKFLDWDGSLIQTVKYHYGDTITAIADPERASDETYTYTFLFWNKALGTCTGDASFTAQYESTFINYTVVFKDYDGSVISRKTYHFGDTITIPADPVRVSDETYTYTFKDWGNISTSCNGNKEYTAVYKEEYIDYTVTFKDHDGSVISTQTYHFGDDVTAPQNPTRPANNTYAYDFAGWDKDIVACAGDATYTATYDSAYIDYTVIFKNEDGTVLSTNTYHYGDEVTAPEAPVKAADNTYTYTFKAWDKTVVDCAGDATYTATYDSAYIDYTVIFKNEDGTVLSTNTYHYGDEVTAPETPTKEADDEYTYTFKAWDKTVVDCAGDATYTATYTATAIEDTNTPGTDTEPNEPDTDVNTPSDNDTNDENEGLSGGAVAGIVAGSTVAAGAGGFSLFWFVIKKKKWSDLVRVFKK